MNESGVELFQPAYANILATEDTDRYIVLDRSKAGVVNSKGETIIPVQFDLIYCEYGAKYFVVQRGEKVGLFGFDGKQRTPIEYDGYRGLQTFGSGGNMDALIALKKNGKYYFANKSGFIDQNGFDHFNYSNEVLKTYDASGISVFLFDNRGRIEDRSDYPLYEKAMVSQNYYDGLKTLDLFETSELEENQQAGYFGLRWYRKRGFGVSPVYRTVRENTFGDYFGIVPIGTNTYSLTENETSEVVSE